MRSSKTATATDKSQETVIKNAHSAAEQQAIGDRWADHKGPRMTLAQTLAYAAEHEPEQQEQPAN